MSPQGPSPRQGPNNRTILWIVAVVAVVVLLVRSHHLSTFSVLAFVAFVPSIILHELTHGAVAHALGDDTAKRQGLLTWNPVKHIDPFGTVLIPALMALTTFGVLGWAKPMPWTRNRLRHSRRDDLLVYLSGPAVNALLALVFLVAYRYGVPLHDKFGFDLGPVWAQFLFYAGYINALLTILYLIPLPPLDGAAVVERFLPPQQLSEYQRIRPFTIFVPVALVLLFPQAFNHIFIPALNRWAQLAGV